MGFHRLPTILNYVFSRTFNLQRITTNNFNTILVGNIGHNLFSGRTNDNSTPYTTTTTSYSSPIGVNFIRTLNILVSAIIVYDYATFVVLLTPTGIAAKLANVSLLRTTTRCRLNDFNIIFVTVALTLFDFSAFVNVLFCTHSGITCLFNSH